jgi:hypothetical protein
MSPERFVKGESERTLGFLLFPLNRAETSTLRRNFGDSETPIRLLFRFKSPKHEKHGGISLETIERCTSEADRNHMVFIERTAGSCFPSEAPPELVKNNLLQKGSWVRSPPPLPTFFHINTLSDSSCSNRNICSN